MKGSRKPRPPHVDPVRSPLPLRLGSPSPFLRGKIPLTFLSCLFKSALVPSIWASHPAPFSSSFSQISWPTLSCFLHHRQIGGRRPLFSFTRYFFCPNTPMELSRPSQWTDYGQKRPVPSKRLHALPSIPFRLLSSIEGVVPPATPLRVCQVAPFDDRPRYLALLRQCDPSLKSLAFAFSSLTRRNRPRTR